MNTKPRRKRRIKEVSPPPPSLLSRIVDKTLTIIGGIICVIFNFIILPPIGVVLAVAYLIFVFALIVLCCVGAGVAIFLVFVAFGAVFGMIFSGDLWLCLLGLWIIGIPFAVVVWAHLNHKESNFY